jgi:hypothetical protein
MEPKPGRFALTLGFIGMTLGGAWWAIQFKGDGNFISCMWWWSMKCSFASGAFFLGRGSEIQYSPLLFLAGLVCVVVGLVRAGVHTPAEETNHRAKVTGVSSDRERELLGLPPRRAPRIVDFDVRPTKFHDIESELSAEARRVLLAAKEAGYRVRRDVDQEVLILERDEESYRLESNEAVLGWARAQLRQAGRASH